MNDRSLAISILQKARDTLGERLTQRIVESQSEIEADATGASYLSEIETIYDQLGSRLAHLNAMLSHLPATGGPVPADATASEIIYADLASGYSTALDLEATAPLTLLALPAPANDEERAMALVPGNRLCAVASYVQVGDLVAAGRTVSELLDIRPSQARRCAFALARRIMQHPDLVRRIAALPPLVKMTEQAAAALLAECFEFSTAEALEHARFLRESGTDSP